ACRPLNFRNVGGGALLSNPLPWADWPPPAFFQKSIEMLRAFRPGRCASIRTFLALVQLTGVGSPLPRGAPVRKSQVRSQTTKQGVQGQLLFDGLIAHGNSPERWMKERRRFGDLTGFFACRGFVFSTLGLVFACCASAGSATPAWTVKRQHDHRRHSRKPAKQETPGKGLSLRISKFLSTSPQSFHSLAGRIGSRGATLCYPPDRC